MTPKHYQIWFMPGPGSKPYPVNDYPTLSETRFALCNSRSDKTVQGCSPE